MQVAFQMNHFLINGEDIDFKKNCTSLASLAVSYRNDWIRRLHSYLCCGLFRWPRIAAERQFIIRCQRWGFRPTEIRTELARKRDRARKKERERASGETQLDQCSPIPQRMTPLNWFFLVSQTQHTYQRTTFRFFFACGTKTYNAAGLLRFLN